MGLHLLCLGLSFWGKRFRALCTTAGHSLHSLTDVDSAAAFAAQGVGHAWSAYLNCLLGQCARHHE